MAKSDRQLAGRKGLRAGRIESLTDGVFAVAMTLLIFDLKIPKVPQDATLSQFIAALTALWPQVLCFVTSFLTTGTLWVAHRGQFHWIERTDRFALWINLVFLLLITAIPFSTNLLAAYPHQSISVVVYATHLLVTAMTLYCHWQYVTGPAALVSAGLPEALVRAQGRRILVGPLLYLMAIGFAPWNTWIGISIFVLIPIVYTLPGKVDRHWLELSDES